jgi:hypothetical protein
MEAEAFEEESGVREEGSASGHYRAAVSLCAEHVRQLGGASPLHNLMEVKC